jgi:serine/threonine-protein kinase
MAADPLKPLFLAALEKPTPAERASFLNQACAGDAALRQQVEALLRANDQPDSLLDHTDAGGAAGSSNLLFGLAALQAGLIDPNRFAQACSDWAACQDMPLADLLVARGWLTPADRAEVEKLLDQRLTGHEGVPPPSPPGALPTDRAGPGVQPREPQQQTGTAGSLPHSPQWGSQLVTERSGRVQLYGEIARGGMGAVLKGWDTGLGRDVAVKVLLEAHAGKAELVQRFVEEAQVAGQLQHPGVVPVYELGQFGDKRPYFAMKLVQGQTLAGLLALRRQPAEDQPRFVGIFEQVCQTVAYAHSKGVIHRDLKPANVMVGAFGEVQVMDWGLAKVLDAASRGLTPPEEAAGEEAVSLIATARSGGPDDSGQTQVGTALGTPAYLAPEQARGEVQRVDERADVFGLGAFLCEILTGQPAYLGSSVAAMLQARNADLSEAFARLDGCGADAELVALARRCLAPEPAERPRNAGEVAGAVTAYQRSVAERLRQAEMERAQAQVKAAEERKRQRLSLALAGSVLVTVLLGAGGGLWLQQQQAQRRLEAARHEADLREESARRQAERRQAAESALGKSAQLQRQGRWGEAKVVLEQARQRLGEQGENELVGRVRQALADLELVERLEAIRLEVGRLTERHFAYERADRKYTEAFRRAGLATPGEPAGRVAGRVARSRIRAVLVAALDDWAARAEDPPRRDWLLAVSRAADPGDRGARFRDPRLWQDRAALQKLAGEADVDGLSPQLLTLLGLAVYSSGGDPLPLLRRAQERYPDDFWLTFHLGTFSLAAKQKGAAGYLRAALALRPGTAVVSYNLGVALAGEGRAAEAVGCFQKAIRLHPKWAMAHHNLGTALYQTGRVEEAIASLRMAISRAPKYAQSHSNLGDALTARVRLEEALASYRRAIALDPNRAAFHTGLGRTLNHLARPDEAIASFRKAIALDPRSALAHAALGETLFQQGQFAQAEASTLHCLRLLPAGDPMRPVVTQQLQRCRHFQALEKKVPDLLSGRLKPPGVEGIEYAQMCFVTRRYRTAARLYAEAFGSDAKEAGYVRAACRLEAAYCAALTGCGQGRDAGKLEEERAPWRKQALDWLRADLAARSKLLESSEPKVAVQARHVLRHLRRDPKLACVRDEQGLNKLPEAERARWQKLWGDVAAALKRVPEKPRRKTAPD